MSDKFKEIKESMRQTLRSYDSFLIGLRDDYNNLPANTPDEVRTKMKDSLDELEIKFSEVMKKAMDLKII